MSRPYHTKDGHWSDALITAFLPASGLSLPADAPDTPKQPRQQDGWRRFRWLQDYRPGMDAEHLLRTYGIPVSSRCIPSKSCPGAEVGFSVPERQAVWAEYLLCRAGWRLITPLLDERNQAALERAHSEGASRPVGGGRIRRQGIVAKFYGIMDEIAGQGAAHREHMAPPKTQWRHVPTPKPVALQRAGLVTWLQKLFLGELRGR